MSFQRDREDEEFSGTDRDSFKPLAWIAGGAVAGFFALTGVVGTSVAALVYTISKAKKTQEATLACLINEPNLRIKYKSEEQAKVLLDTVATKIDVSLVFSPVCIFKAPEYAHVALKFDFQQNGQTVTIVMAGVCAESHHILEPEVTFSEPEGTFKIMSCGEIFMAPCALMKMCEGNPSNNTVYEVYKNNCYHWALEFGKLLKNGCGKEIVSTIERLRDSQNLFLVYLGDVGHILSTGGGASSSSSQNK